MEPDLPFQPAAAAPLPQLELRPLSTGELLDRVFFLYRSRPRLFWAVALVPALAGLLGGAAQLLATRGHIVPANPRVPFASMQSPLTASADGLTALVSLLAYALVQAAITRLTMQLTLGQLAAANEALRAELPRTLRYIGIELWKVWSALWLPLIFVVAGAIAFARFSKGIGGLLIFLGMCAFIYGIIAYIRNSLGIPASVVEGLGVAAAMRRSKALVAGRKWRIFLLFLLVIVLYFVAGLISLPFTLFLFHAKETVRIAGASAVSLVISFLLSLLLTPIVSIALCLFYFDERVRREGFDIDLLLRGPDAARQAPMAGAPPADLG